MKIGFIGLGNMGAPMATNLAKAGHTVLGFDTVAKPDMPLDCSTVDVESARDVAAAALSHNLLAVDAPVSGGIGGATAGTLTFMAGAVRRHGPESRALW